MRRIRTHSTPTIALGASLLVAALALAGCSAASSSDRPAGIVVGSSAEYDRSTVEDAQLADGAGGDAAAPAAADRSVIVTGWMTVTVDEPGAAADDVVAIAEKAGGRIDGRTEYAPSDTDNGSATLTLRVPSEALDAVVDELKSLGELQDLSLTSSDVTTQVQDVDARVATLRATIERLTALAGSAATTADLIELETAISDRQYELESYEAQQRSLADQVDMSTLELSLITEQQTPPTTPDDFGDGVSTGWDAFVAFWAGFLVVIGVLLPWLVLAVLVLAVILIARRVRRRRRAAPPAPVAEAPVDEPVPAPAPKAAPRRRAAPKPPTAD
jgi:hypothetical protein